MYINNRTSAFQDGARCPAYRLTHFSIGGAGQDAPPTVGCASPEQLKFFDRYSGLGDDNVKFTWKPRKILVKLGVTLVSDRGDSGYTHP